MLSSKDWFLGNSFIMWILWRYSKCNYVGAEKSQVSKSVYNSGHTCKGQPGGTPDWFVSTESDVLKLQAIKIKNVNHPFVVVNVYVCNAKINCQDCQFLHEIATFQKNVIFCWDFNDKSRLWGNTHTNKQFAELEDALVFLTSCTSTTAG